jgi:hypothetical protein
MPWTETIADTAVAVEKKEENYDAHAGCSQSKLDGSPRVLEEPSSAWRGREAVVTRKELWSYYRWFDVSLTVCR